MNKENAKSYEDVVAFLNTHPGAHAYGDIAESLGYTRKTGGQAVGAMMRALHNRGHHEYCRRVVSDETGEHRCDALLEPSE